jgi:hypothetical protein
MRNEHRLAWEGQGLDGEKDPRKRSQQDHLGTQPSWRQPRQDGGCSVYIKHLLGTHTCHKLLGLRKVIQMVPAEKDNCHLAIEGTCANLQEISRH